MVAIRFPATTKTAMIRVSTAPFMFTDARIRAARRSAAIARVSPAISPHWRINGSHLLGEPAISEPVNGYNYCNHVAILLAAVKLPQANAPKSFLSSLI